MKITLLGRVLIRRQGHILDEPRVAGHRGKQHPQKETKRFSELSDDSLRTRGVILQRRMETETRETSRHDGNEVEDT